MITYLMDSSVLIRLARNSQVIRDHLEEILLTGAELAICEPVALEVLAGVNP